jgi:hypothetical protein
LDFRVYSSSPEHLTQKEDDGDDGITQLDH